MTRRVQCTRRVFLGAAGALLAAGCASSESSRETAGVTVSHAFGETTVPAPPQRVVSVGFTEQDDLLALGVIPVATTEWFGGEPFAVWPWARAALGPAQPQVLSLADGIQVGQIAALRPDLIVATNAGVDADTYSRLSAIAPTLPQSGPEAFFEPWKTQATSIGEVVDKRAEMEALIAAVDEKFTSAGAAHPQFKDKKVALLAGTPWQGEMAATTPGWRTDFLTQMGFVIAGFGNDADADRARIPLNQLAAVVDEADVLIWTTESDAEQAALLANPDIAAARDRSIFTTKELAGAIAFSSPLSLPLVAQQLPPLLAGALGG
jgi:iron complex transport system substrate-binding protein